MHRHKIWTSWLNRNADKIDHPCQVPFSFHSLSWSFSCFMFLQAGSTKPCEFIQLHFQLRLLWSDDCELHAKLHCWELYCFMSDIPTARGEPYYPPVMQRRQENNAGTFETARKINSLHSCEKHAFHITLFKTPRHLNFLSEQPSWSLFIYFC